MTCIIYRRCYFFYPNNTLKKRFFLSIFQSCSEQHLLQIFMRQFHVYGLTLDLFSKLFRGRRYAVRRKDGIFNNLSIYTSRTSPGWNGQKCSRWNKKRGVIAVGGRLDRFHRAAVLVSFIMCSEGFIKQSETFLTHTHVSWVPINAFWLCSLAVKRFKLVSH